MKSRLFHLTGIRQQLTFKTAGIVCIAFAVCYLLTYYYFSHILQRRALDDNVSILQQHVQQIEYLNGDVRSLAETLAVNQGVQRVLSNQNLVSDTGQKPQAEHFVQLHNAMSNVRWTCSSKRYFRRGILVAQDGTGFFWGYSAHGVYFRETVSTAEYRHFRQSPHTSRFYGPDSEGNLKFWMQIQDIGFPQRELGAIALTVDFGSYREAMLHAADSFSGYLVLGGDGDEIVYRQNLDPARLEQVAGSPAYRDTIRIDETPGGFLLSHTDPVSGWVIVAFIDRVDLTQGGRVILPFVSVALLLTLLLCLLLIRPTVHSIVRPLEQLTQAMQRVSAGQAETEMPVCTDNEVGVLAGTFHQMLQDLSRSMLESMEHEKEQQRLQTELLLSQMNPHFIYNTLNSIVYMARRAGNGDIVCLTTAFIKILQDIIPEEGAGMFTTVGRDIDIVRAYLTIQHYRYADLFQERITVDPHAAGCRIPRFIIQPLVENAIFHGLSPKGSGGVLTIQAEREEGFVRIAVRDNGVGMDAPRTRQLLESGDPGYHRYGTRSIGVSNIRARLDSVYGGRYRLRIESAPGSGTAFLLHLPVNGVTGSAP